MNHAITVGGLLLSVCALIGIAGIAVGVLDLFAEGMSDAQQQGTPFGCFSIPIGAAVLIASVVGLII